MRPNTVINEGMAEIETDIEVVNPKTNAHRKIRIRVVAATEKDALALYRELKPEVV